MTADPIGRRIARPISEALRVVQERSAPKTRLAAVQSAWREAVGDAIADVAEPVSEKDGVILIRCTGSVWAQELDLMQLQIVGRLTESIGEDLDLRLRFVAG